MTLTRKQLDRLQTRLKYGLKIVPFGPIGVEAGKSDLVMCSRGRYMSLYIVIDKHGITIQRKVIFHKED